MIAASRAYIKLGRAGCWEGVSLERGEIHFRFAGIPHDVALTGDREAILAAGIAGGRDPRAAAEDAREILDFYRMGSDHLWVTFARDHLWHAHAAPEVEWLGGDGSRMAPGSGVHCRGGAIRMRSDGHCGWVLSAPG